jgi:hypothetical protein
VVLRLSAAAQPGTLAVFDKQLVRCFMHPILNPPPSLADRLFLFWLEGDLGSFLAGVCKGAAGTCSDCF